ncbi:MAG: hypothetical protein QY327_01365 [Fimbriimonadaceae bacterium]|nr:MAG: hypothetical protein QY327_01365 [Fimbriimonadaceae bacterium]
MHSLRPLTRFGNWLRACATGKAHLKYVQLASSQLSNLWRSVQSQLSECVFAPFIPDCCKAEYSSP